jgi:hypothetical protein
MTANPHSKFRVANQNATLLLIHLQRHQPTSGIHSNSIIMSVLRAGGAGSSRTPGIPRRNTKNFQQLITPGRCTPITPNPPGRCTLVTPNTPVRGTPARCTLVRDAPMGWPMGMPVFGRDIPLITPVKCTPECPPVRDRLMGWPMGDARL